MPADPIKAVPANVITGFLGAGKTTAVLHLLEKKPAEERWAVLVNEFGEIGIDGSLVRGVTGENGVHISEVPGGCMCCAAGVPMQVALNQLLRRARPHRLLIEPTGLGHPSEVLDSLSGEFFRDALAVGKTVTLVDARKLRDERYTKHATFLEQLGIADVVVANKSDLYTLEDRSAFDSFVSQHCSPTVETLVTEFGRLPLDSLDGKPGRTFGTRHAHTTGGETVLAADLPFPESGIVTARNKGEGFESVGWRFDADKVFDHRRLYGFLAGLNVERMKAVFRTDRGVFGYNLTRDGLTETPLAQSDESRVEIIAEQVQDGWGDALVRCVRDAHSEP